MASGKTSGSTGVSEWLHHAVGYAGDWLDYQTRVTQLPGCVLAVRHAGELVAERAFGVANLATGEAMTPRHRFRVASHSKTFTAAGMMRLRELGRIRLSDPAGQWVEGLPDPVSAITIAQLLSHSGGLMRDGSDAPHWHDRGSFFDKGALFAEFSKPLTFPTNSSFKYSNLGFGLVALVIESATGEPYADWIAREIVKPSGLAQTTPDVPDEAGQIPMASGHCCCLPLGRRSILAGPKPTNALAAATGFTSTAGDLTRFFASLDPESPNSILSVESRREMTRRHWAVPYGAAPRWYGLGTIHGAIAGHAWYGHMGSFPGFITRTSHVPQWNVTVSVMTNAIDGLANQWTDGILGIMAAFSRQGAPQPAVSGWNGRWWTIWAPIDLVPMGNKVLVADPASLMPFVNASEIEVSSATAGTIVIADGIKGYGESVARTLDAGGATQRLQLGGNRYVAEVALQREIEEREAAADRA